MSLQASNAQNTGIYLTGNLLKLEYHIQNDTKKWVRQFSCVFSVTYSSEKKGEYLPA
jgi:hypothetical protein